MTAQEMTRDEKIDYITERFAMLTEEDRASIIALISRLVSQSAPSPRPSPCREEA